MLRRDSPSVTSMAHLGIGISAGTGGWRGLIAAPAEHNMEALAKYSTLP